MFARHKGIIILILVSLFLRAGIVGYALQWRENTDILRWKDRARIAYLYDFADTYKTDHLLFGTYPNNMPPGGQYIISGVYWGWLQIGKALAYAGIPPGSNDWVNGPLLTLLLRIPSLLGDVGIALILYIIVQRYTKSRNSGLFAAGIFLFNPAVIFNSAFMGQRDSINNFLFLLGVLAFIDKKYAWAAAWVACSLLVKFSLIFTVPLFMYGTYLATKSWRPVALSVLVAVSVTMAGVLPVSLSPFSWYFNYFLRNVSGEMPNLTAFAFNIWWVIFRPAVTFGPNTDAFSASDIRLIGTPFVAEVWWGVPAGMWATMFFILFCIPVVIGVFRSGKRAVTPKYLTLLLSMVCLAAYLWLPKMHDRYMYPVFPLLAIAIGLGVPALKEFIALSLLNIVNLFVVWHPMRLTDFWYSALSNRDIQWYVSIVTVFVSILLYVRATSYAGKR